MRVLVDKQGKEGEAASRPCGKAGGGILLGIPCYKRHGDTWSESSALR